MNDAIDEFITDSSMSLNMLLLLCGHWTVNCMELALFNDISWTSRFIDVFRSKRLVIFTGATHL